MEESSALSGSIHAAGLHFCGSSDHAFKASALPLAIRCFFLSVHSWNFPRPDQDQIVMEESFPIR